MSELINKTDNRATIRWKLLTGVSALALTAYVSSAGVAKAEDIGRPQVWLTLGSNVDQLSDSSEPFDPPFLTQIPANLGSPLKAEKLPDIGIDREAGISFQPDGSDWVFTLFARYGHASKKDRVRNQTNPPSHTNCSCFYPSPVNFPARYQDTQSQNSETHKLLDFMAGKDVGLGLFSLPGSSVLSGGARYAAFTSKSAVAIAAIPYVQTSSYHHRYYAGKFAAKRSFSGIGPVIAWDASTPFAGNKQDGEFTFDWGVNGAVLFGRQKARGSHSTKGVNYCGHGYQSYGFYFSSSICIISQYLHSKPINRSRRVVVPNLGGYAGISLRYANAKVSFGYRVDEFFGAIDGGIDTAKKENRSFYGPFASISVGLGD